ncbi:hypothetical protein Tco_0730774, partial [Tanacetum coccineum]
MPNTRSEASMTHEEVEELVNRRVAEEMETREAARTLEPLNENGDEQEGENGGNGNGGNGENRNGNRNGNHGMNYGGFMPVVRECTFQDFLKCKPQNFSGTEGVVGLTRWFEKMETVFNISNCIPKYQVKYATCTLQDSALTWWNSHKRTIGVEAAARAYAISGGGTNPDSNVVTGMFLLNNCYASMLFDSGADRSFVSITFSALLDVTPTTLDTSYAIELADGRISETNIILRGCTLGLLGHPFDIDLMPVELGSFDVII